MEKFINVLGANSDTRILHGDEQIQRVVGNFAAHCQRDCTGLRVFDGVGQKIRDNLLDAHIVAEQNFRELRINLRDERQIFFMGAVVNHVDKVVNRCNNYEDSILAPSVAAGIAYKTNIEQKLEDLMSDAEYSMFEKKYEMKNTPQYRERLEHGLKVDME